MEDYIWTIVLVLLIGFNAFVSVFIYKRDDLNSFQKKAQIIVVWLIPFLASLGLYLFHRNSDKDYEASKKFGGGSGNDSKQADGGAFHDI